MHEIGRRLGGRRLGGRDWRRRDWLALVPLVLAAAILLLLLGRPSSGVVALAVVLEVQLVVFVFVVFSPIALLARSRAVGLALVVLLVATGCRFGSDWISLPVADGRGDLTVLDWNVQQGARAPAELAAALDDETVDLIALEEVEPDAGAALAADRALTSNYPYQVLAARPGSRGLAILSRYPLANAATFADPSIVTLDLQTPRGVVRVVCAHPLPARIATVTPLRLPVDLDPTMRDEAIARVRSHVDPALAAGERLLVLGDYNTSPTEAEYPVLTNGLRDTQTEVGEGPGWTWRPSRFTFLPVAFVRIDLQLTAGAIVPVSTSVDCSLPGDHCRLRAAYRID